MSDLVKIIPEDAFETEVIASPILVLVDFYADWCGPCKALAPTLNRVAAERDGKVKIVKVNVEEAPALAAQFNVRNIPYLVFIKNGQKVGEMAGNQTQQALLSAIDAAI